MTDFVTVWDSTKEIYKKSSTDLASLTSISVNEYEYFFASASGTVGIPEAITGKTIHVYVNGVLRRITEDYTLDTVNNEVDFVANQAANSWVHVDVFQNAVEYDSNFNVGVGGQANFTVSSGTFAGGTRIEVFQNGVKKREGSGQDYVRNVSLQRIEFTYTVPQNAWVLVRLHS